MFRPLDICQLITGTLTEENPQAPGQNIKIVYQRVKSGLGAKRYSGSRDIQRRRWVQTPHANTELQLAHKASFANAVAAWQALTQEEKQTWRSRGRARNLPAYHAFISDYRRSNQLPSLDPATVPRRYTLTRTYVAPPVGVFEVRLFQ